MKEIPILMSTPMVKSTMADRKTNTLCTRGLELINENPDDWMLKTIESKDTSDFKNISKKDVEFALYSGDTNNLIYVKCPYGKHGDLLWVRERFRKYYWQDENQSTDWENPIIDYAADNPENILQKDGDGFQMYNKDGSEKYITWKPSIHMPKSAARIWLKVIQIKVERLQDIKEEDAIAEGVKFSKSTIGNCYYNYITGGYNKTTTAYHSFRTLWQSINGKDSWNANPWVWVIKFEVVSKTGKPTPL